MASDPIRRLTRREARRLAITSQLLDAERPRDILDVVERLGSVQMDPTAAVARSEHLVLWSRLGSGFDPERLSALLYEERALFEHRAFIFPTAHYPLRRALMTLWPEGDTAWPRRVRAWLRDNAAFVEFVLAELEARGPLLSRELDDRSVRPWRSTGWSDRRNVSQMLEFLAARGEVAVVGRRGNQRVWDLVSRAMPAGVPAIDPDEARRTLARQRLRSMGIIRAERDHPHGVRVEVEGLPGEWIADPGGLERGFTGRTALLSPFDRLVYDRDRARQLFGFEYRLEMYVPEARRRWGYYVLPALRGDRLVAKVDARFDRHEAALRVPTIHLEAHTDDDDLEAVTTELDGLARWLGASDVVIERTETQPRGAVQYRSCVARARWTARASEAELRRILLADEGFVEVLRAVRELDLPQAAIGAGAVRAVVWDALSGREPPTRIEEVDVAYFDGRVLSPEVEDRAERRLAGQLPQYRWDVKNQAAVHTWYERRFGVAVEPLRSLEEAVGTWPETATAVAVRLEEDDDLTVIAPLGLEDLFGMVWRYNPARATRAAFLRRLADKRPEGRWPSVRVMDPH